MKESAAELPDQVDTRPDSIEWDSEGDASPLARETLLNLAEARAGDSLISSWVAEDGREIKLVRPAAPHGGSRVHVGTLGLMVDSHGAVYENPPPAEYDIRGTKGVQVSKQLSRNLYDRKRKDDVATTERAVSEAETWWLVHLLQTMKPARRL